MPARPHPEGHLQAALNAVASGGYEATLDALPVPIYMTDAQGSVTYWNRACVALAGREPQLGQDKWCVTWRIYTTTNEFMPHDQCPMARAIQEKRSIRGDVAIAERPDGSRCAFMPYPTPLFDSEGELIGAINMLIDVSEEQVSALADQAARCRRLASATFDRSTTDLLDTMAAGYDESAKALKP